MPEIVFWALIGHVRLMYLKIFNVVICIIFLIISAKADGYGNNQPDFNGYLVLIDTNNKLDFFREEPIHVTYMLKNGYGRMEDMDDKYFDFILPVGFNFTDNYYVYVDERSNMMVKKEIIDSRKIRYFLNFFRDREICTNISYNITYDSPALPIRFNLVDYVRPGWGATYKIKRIENHTIRIKAAQIEFRNSSIQIPEKNITMQNKSNSNCEYNAQQKYENSYSPVVAKNLRLQFLLYALIIIFLFFFVYPAGSNRVSVQQCVLFYLFL
jgi:hypothetical protein